MNFAKLAVASLLLVCACDKPDDKMQSPGMASASGMTTSTMAPTMAPSGTMMAPAHDMGGSMGMATDAGTMMAPAMGSMSAPMMNDKKPPMMAPKMGASANHM